MSKEVIRMGSLLTEITKEITGNLVSEFKGSHGFSQNSQNDHSLWQMLMKEIAKEVVRQIRQENSEDLLNSFSIQANGKGTQDGLSKAEEKLGRVFDRTKVDRKEKEKDIEKIELDDLDDVDFEDIEKLRKKGFSVIYPNLKYRKPKYQNVNELLKYVESDKGKPDGVKLVIMNFND